MVSAPTIDPSLVVDLTVRSSVGSEVELRRQRVDQNQLTELDQKATERS